MADSPESICALAAGDERAAYNAFGKPFQIEACGVFGNCDHQVEKYDFSSGGGVHVVVYYCSVDYMKVGGCVLFVIALLVVVWKLAKRAKQRRMEARM